MGATKRMTSSSSSSSSSEESQGIDPTQLLEVSIGDEPVPDMDATAAQASRTTFAQKMKKLRQRMKVSIQNRSQQTSPIKCKDDFTQVTPKHLKEVSTQVTPKRMVSAQTSPVNFDSSPNTSCNISPAAVPSTSPASFRAPSPDYVFVPASPLPKRSPNRSPITPVPSLADSYRETLDNSLEAEVVRTTATWTSWTPSTAAAAIAQRQVMLPEQVAALTVPGMCLKSIKNFIP